MLFLLIRWSIADTHHIVHIDWPSNPNPEALIWFIIHPQQSSVPRLLLHIKGKSPPCFPSPFFLKSLYPSMAALQLVSCPTVSPRSQSDHSSATAHRPCNSPCVLPVLHVLVHRHLREVLLFSQKRCESFPHNSVLSVLPYLHALLLHYIQCRLSAADCELESKPLQRKTAFSETRD